MSVLSVAGLGTSKNGPRNPINPTVISLNPKEVRESLQSCRKAGEGVSEAQAFLGQDRTANFHGSPKSPHTEVVIHKSGLSGAA